MSATPEPVRKAELHAFVDGQLDPARRREVEAYLAANADAAARVDAYTRQKAALRAVFDPVLDETLPRSLRPPRATRRGVHVAWAAAAAVMLIVGGVAGYQVRNVISAAQQTEMSGPGQNDVVHQAAVAHAVFTPQRRHPVEVGSDEEAHLVAWLSKVLGAPLRAPHLVDLGYSLVGGRLLSAPNGPAAQFMYENADKHRLTLYVVNDPTWKGKTEFRYAEQRGISVFYWIDGSLGYALTAELPRPKLLAIATAVHKQLER
jgi:anti-sigma factor RsiW